MNLPSLIVRLREKTGKVAKQSIEFPRDFAVRLILNRLAVPVIDLLTIPDVVVSEDELEGVTIGPDTSQESQAA
jgi:hypothetical protein